MAYTLNSGIEKSGLDNTQRSLMVSLPIIALILSFGAIHKHNPGNPPPVSTHIIPVVSSLSVAGTSGGKGGGPSNPPAAVGSGGTSGAQQSSTSAPTTGGSSLGSTTGIVGGKGGGPTGSGGGVAIPDCSINQVATVTCVVPECPPEVTLSPGQKAVLGLNGTCLVVN